MKTCPICKKEHIKVAKECSSKCKILNRHKIENECWQWIGKINNAGYGEFVEGINGKKIIHLSHRKSYEIFKGEIPKGLCVCHSCDNKKCCNPEHLWVGTQKENIQDAKRKGRLPDQKGRKHTEETKKKFKFRKGPDKKGEKHHMAKLTENDVREIKKLLETKIKRNEILKMFKITRPYLYAIKSKKAWPHLV